MSNKMSIRYQNMIALLFLYGGRSIESLSKLYGVSRTYWKGWKKKFKDGEVYQRGILKNSKVFLRDEQIFYDLLKERIAEEYFDSDRIFNKVKSKLQERSSIDPNMSKIAEKMKPRIQNYKDVVLALIDACLS